MCSNRDYNAAQTFLPIEVRQLVKMMKILIRLLNKIAPILIATLSVRHGYKMR